MTEVFRARIFSYILLVTFCDKVMSLSKNISCYQCVQYTNQECGPETILPCPSHSDRCVTHISKDKQHGFVLKRECGLGPCSFDDENINRGLGWNICDRTKEEFFCVFCCKENACNKNAATHYNYKKTDTLFPFLLCLFLYFC